MATEHDLNPQIYDHLNSVIKLDMYGNLLTYNQAFAKQYGYIEQDFNKPFLDIFIKDETFEHKYFFEHAILGDSQSFDAVGRCKDGKEIQINVKLLPIHTKEGTDIYAIVKDISDQQLANQVINSDQFYRSTIRK